MNCQEKINALVEDMEEWGDSYIRLWARECRRSMLENTDDKTIDAEYENEFGNKNCPSSLEFKKS